MVLGFISLFFMKRAILDPIIFYIYVYTYRDLYACYYTEIYNNKLPFVFSIFYCGQFTLFHLSSLSPSPYLINAPHYFSYFLLQISCTMFFFCHLLLLLAPHFLSWILLVLQVTINTFKFRNLNSTDGESMLHLSFWVWMISLNVKFSTTINLPEILRFNFS